MAELGFTHVELMPIMQHPYAPSWGYQVSGYFAPQSTFGTPDDFRALVDAFHAAGIGVLLDWVPAHFPRDEWALARFDGTALYEHDDPRRGAHPDWGTLIFNLSRHEVRNFLLANALYWVREFHADGLRVDAVASMLYLDYSRDPGQWVSNEQGGRENLEAVAFLRELNEVLHAREPGVAVIAEESTAWPGVSRPTSMGGLGFTFKWNMGWMNDTLTYVEHEPVHRQFHHDELTFSLVYAWDENFVLPLSHDEVVHGKRSLLSKLPGDRWQQLATLRALYGLMWAHPGKQLLFMGGELAEWGEWSEGRSLDWPLLDDPDHAGVSAVIRDLNATYRAQPALWQIDFRPEGFAWLVGDARDENVIAFARFGTEGAPLVCVVNFSPIVREGWRLPLPVGGRWREAINTDSRFYAGSDVGNGLGVTAEASPLHGQPFSAPRDAAAAGHHLARAGVASPSTARRSPRADRAARRAVPISSAERPLPQPAIEADHDLEQAGVGRVALVGQLDEDGAAVVGILPPVDEPALLEPVEVAGQRRAFDPDGAGEVVLGAPGGRLQVREHEPGRNRAAGLGERAVERTANRLRRLEEPEPERGRGGTHCAAAYRETLPS